MRLFVGIDLPKNIKEKLLDFQSDLKDLGVKGSWKAQDNFHITLEFLGELESPVVQALTETLKKMTINSKPFRITLEGLGGFPTMKKPHTLWTGVGGSLPQLNYLKAETHKELLKMGLTLEEREFKPHITLASRPQLNGRDLSFLQRRTLGEFIVEEVVLFESKAIQGKRIYTGLYRRKLGA